VVEATKSDAGRRVIALPAALVALLDSHCAAQLRLKAEARQQWHEGCLGLHLTNW
jgi:hypothetical protein